MWILLAQAKSAQRLALNSKHGQLIRPHDHGASAADRAGSSRAVRDARRARCGSLEGGRVLAACSRPVTLRLFGRERAAEDARNVSRTFASFGSPAMRGRETDSIRRAPERALSVYFCG